MSSTGLEDFELLTELGQGAMGRVYLARERALGDRPIVLKVTHCRGQEHLSLARLQHTHIVPLYFAQEDPDKDHRVLCMPYFGTVTLASMLIALKEKPSEERTGADMLAVLDRARSEAAIPLSP